MFLFKSLFKPAKRAECDSVVQWVLNESGYHFPDLFAEESADKYQREAKFQAISVFFAMALHKLKDDVELAQQVHDEMFDRFDIAMREQGVADVRVGAEIRKLSSAFQGRMASYTQAFDADSASKLEEALLRNEVADDESAGGIAQLLIGYWQSLDANSSKTWFKNLSKLNSAA